MLALRVEVQRPPTAGSDVVGAPVSVFDVSLCFSSQVPRPTATVSHPIEEVFLVGSGLAEPPASLRVRRIFSYSLRLEVQTIIFCYAGNSSEDHQRNALPPGNLTRPLWGQFGALRQRHSFKGFRKLRRLHQIHIGRLGELITQEFRRNISFGLMRV